MHRFKLVVLPDGHAIITTEEELSASELSRTFEAWEMWRRKEPPAVLVATGTDVVLIEDIELDIGEK